MTSGAEFRFRASFAVVKEIGQVVYIPDICFMVLKLKLLDFTSLRAKRDWDANDDMMGTPKKYLHTTPRPGSRMWETEHDIYRESKTSLNAVPGEQVVELGEATKVVGDSKEMGQARQCEC